MVLPIIIMAEKNAGPQADPKPHVKRFAGLICFIEWGISKP
jgi:hypothetical protein